MADHAKSDHTTSGNKKKDYAKHIRHTAAILQTEGLSDTQMQKLEERLPFIWCLPLTKPLSSEDDHTTYYRKKAALSYYQAIEDRNPHFLIPVLLELPYTSCPVEKNAPDFNKPLSDLIDTYRLHIQPKRSFFEQLALRAGFSTEPRYQKSVTIIFSEGEFYKTNLLLY
jgi:hypothetical protein